MPEHSSCVAIGSKPRILIITLDAVTNVAAYERTTNQCESADKSTVAIIATVISTTYKDLI